MVTFCLVLYNLEINLDLQSEVKVIIPNILQAKTAGSRDSVAIKAYPYPHAILSKYTILELLHARMHTHTHTHTHLKTCMMLK